MKQEKETQEAQALITAQQFAAALSISKRTLEREVAAGRIPRPLKIGSSSRWTRDDLQNYLQRLQVARSSPGPALVREFYQR